MGHSEDHELGTQTMQDNSESTHSTRPVVFLICVAVLLACSVPVWSQDGGEQESKFSKSKATTSKSLKNIFADEEGKFQNKMKVAMGEPKYEAVADVAPAEGRDRAFGIEIPATDDPRLASAFVQHFIESEQAIAECAQGEV